MTEAARPDSPRGHAMGAPPSTPVASRGRPEGSPPTSPDGTRVELFSPKPKFHQGDAPTAPPEVQETAQKTHRLVYLCFCGALFFWCLASRYFYIALTERNMTLAIPGMFWLAVGEIIGIAGAILYRVTENESSAGSIPEQKAPPVHKESPFPGIYNVGNTCFINAPTQALMNDEIYPRIYQDICDKCAKRHQSFLTFLRLYPDQGWLSFFRSKSKKIVDVENIKDVLVMLYNSEIHFDPLKYPNIHRRLGEFSAVTRDANYPDVQADKALLIQEFELMRHDKDVVVFFYQLRFKIEKELLGFKAYKRLIQAYKAAVDSKLSLVSFSGWRDETRIEHIRNLMGQGGSFSQEDVPEFVTCLSKYILTADYPEINIPISYERTFIKSRVQDKEKLKKAKEKHENPQHPGDQLTLMRRDLKLQFPSATFSILDIGGELLDGDDGQALIDKTFKRTIESKEDPQIYIDSAGQANQYDVVEERITTPQELMPSRLIIQLKRFRHNVLTEKVEKINCAVHMPEQATICGLDYRLKSIVVHFGEFDGGHYYALLKKPNPWFYVSDQSVNPALETDVTTAKNYGYLYFYEKFVPPPPDEDD